MFEQGSYASRTPSDLAEVVQAISTLRIGVARDEYEIHRAISDALWKAMICHTHEFKLGPRCRVDFMTVVGTAIEVKHKQINARILLDQLERYAPNPILRAIVVVIDAHTNRLPQEVLGKPLRQIGLNALNGLAI